jgi:ketosteroid isomerase-like protein
MRAIMLGLLAAFAVADAAAADDKADIQAQNDKFCVAAARGDAAGMAAMYAPDAVMLPPDNTVVKGPEIGSVLGTLEKGATNLKLVTNDVVRLSPTYIREIGTWSFDTLGDKPTHLSGTYVVVWKKVGGSWKLWTDIFH